MKFSLLELGKTLKSLRLSRRLSQEELASAAGISRTTVVQIEKGKDAQASSIEAMAQLLGAQLGIVTESQEMRERRQARAENQTKLMASREKHLRIAVQLALGGPTAQTLLAGALRMVQQWHEQQLCSPVYIERWRSILEAPPAQVASNLLAMDDEWGPALRQNTPFAVPGL